jgi:hypothetical protein
LRRALLNKKTWPLSGSQPRWSRTKPYKPLKSGKRASLLTLPPLRTGHESLPSSRTGLLPSSPLRTVHESFQSHSSGPANASLKETRLRDGNTLAMNPVVALWVK